MCERKHIGKIHNQGIVKKVLKTAYKYRGKYSIPDGDAEVKASGGKQPQLEKKDEATLLKMDDMKTTSLLDEKCEEEYSGGNIGGWAGGWASDRTQKIRREVCDQIIRPWFGDLVSDKRLCLIEIPEHKYYLRLNTYLQVLQIPTGINKNTFGTKCSNYSI